MTRLLEGRPLQAIREQVGQAERPERGRRDEIGDALEVERERPQVAREALVGRVAELGQRPVPLGPDRVGVLGDVQLGELLSTLPAPITRRVTGVGTRSNGQGDS